MTPCASSVSTVCPRARASKHISPLPRYRTLKNKAIFIVDSRDRDELGSCIAAVNGNCLCVGNRIERTLRASPRAGQITKHILEDSAQRAMAYLESLARRSVAPDPASVAKLSELNVPLPEASSDASAVLAELDGFVSPATMGMAGPRFFGFVIGGSLPVALVRRFAELLGAAGHQILNDVVLNQVLVKFGDETTTRRTIEAIQQDGVCWAGVTVWQGHTAMRISVASWATTDEDVEQSATSMIRCARAQGA